MVRAMEDMFAEISPETNSISESYLQLYMETIQDLLDPTNDNLSISEDPKSGDTTLPGASLIEVWDQPSFVELLRLGEAHRFAANTKLNTESSRSHAILMVHVKRSVKETISGENGNSKSHKSITMKLPIVRKGKLIVVDLAGSKRIDKSGSEGHTLEEAKSINFSLSALGKHINALAENSHHVPVRDSKLTILLQDSFGGTTRTSLVITIGPSPRHRGETSSTIMLGQRVHQREKREEISMLQNQLLQISFDADVTRKQLEIDDHIVDMNGDMGSLISPIRQEKGSVAKLFEQVGLQKILSLLEAQYTDVGIHALKVIANLAAEAACWTDPKQFTTGLIIGEFLGGTTIVPTHMTIQHMQ